MSGRCGDWAAFTLPPPNTISRQLFFLTDSNALSGRLTMRAEAQKTVDSIQEALALLRRYL
jgi:hypothetical protein